MRKACVAVSAVVLAACGGGGTSFKDPNAVHFTYGTPVAVETGTPEASGAAAGAAGAGDAAGLSEASDDPMAQSLSNLPNDMADSVFGDASGVAAAQARARTAMSHRAAAFAAGDTVTASAGFDDPGCVTVSALEIKYDHCRYTDDVDGTVLTVDGTFDRQVAPESVRVFWDATAGMSLSRPVEGGTLSMTAHNHLFGDVTVAVAGTDLLTIVGSARSDVSASLSAPTGSASMALTHQADLDLDYQPSAQCVTGGTLELKRVWAERPSGATSADLPDLGVKFAWTGCDVATVSWGTLP